MILWSLFIIFSFNNLICNCSKLILNTKTFLNIKTLSFVNEQAMKGTIKAHEEDGNVPNILINVNKMDAYH